MTEPAPYDGQPFAPIGVLTEAEHAWGRRLIQRAWPELGWKVVGRDSAGDLVATTVLPCGAAPQERYCYQTLTAAGLVYRTATVELADGRAATNAVEPSCGRGDAASEAAQALCGPENSPERPLGSGGPDSDAL